MSSFVPLAPSLNSSRLAQCFLSPQCSRGLEQRGREPPVRLVRHHRLMPSSPPTLFSIYFRSRSPRRGDVSVPVLRMRRPWPPRENANCTATPECTGRLPATCGAAPTPTRARSVPARPRRVHVCLSVRGMGPGAGPRGGACYVTGAAAQSAARSRPRRWYWGSEGAVLQNAVSGASGEERSRAGGRRPLRRLGPGTGCRARGPSRLPRPPGALFPPPPRAPGSRRGAPAGAGCPGIAAAAGRAADRPRRDSRGPRSPAAGRRAA